MELVLHVVDEDGFVNLDGIAEPGTHYTAARNDNTGVVRLTPVKVATTVRKSAAPDLLTQDFINAHGGVAVPPVDAPWTP